MSHACTDETCRHLCATPGCTNTIPYCDETYCYTHEPWDGPSGGAA